MTRAVFLDRDGVLVRSFIKDGRPHAPTRIEDYELLPGVAAAVSDLRVAGFIVIVVTNQPDVQRGIIDRATVKLMHAKLTEAMPVNVIRVCYHDDSDDCSCRKPKPGMLIEAAEEFGIDLSSSFMVGDRWRDIEAGKAAGCKTLLVKHDYTERKAEGMDFEVADLPEAAAVILATGI